MCHSDNAALLSDEAEIRGFEGARSLAALGDSGDDALVLNVIRVVGLNVGGKTVEGALDGFLGGRVHHARLGRKRLAYAVVDDWKRGAHVLRCIIRDPGDEGNLASAIGVSMRQRCDKTR